MDGEYGSSKFWLNVLNDLKSRWVWMYICSVWMV